MEAMDLSTPADGAMPVVTVAVGPAAVLSTGPKRTSPTTAHASVR